MNINQTNVVNVKVAYLRPNFNTLEDWCKDPNNIYIGRKGVVFINKKRYPEKDSIWCNPYKINKDGNRDDVLNKYEIYIRNKLEKDESLQNELKKLKNKNLGCWCAPEPCHGNILVKLLSTYENKQ